MNKLVIGSLAAALLLSACASPSSSGAGGLRAMDLRQSQYLAVNTDIYIDLATVQRHLYIHREACEVEVSLVKDPMQVHYATLYYGAADVDDLKERVMLDLTVYATGKLNVKAYSYYSSKKELAYEVVNVLQHPLTCPSGIAINANPNPHVNMVPVEPVEREGFFGD